MSEWISTKERLPEPFQDVLISANGEALYGYYCQHKNCWYAATYSDKFEGHMQFMPREVTCWMELPEPPEVEE